VPEPAGAAATTTSSRRLARTTRPRGQAVGRFAGDRPNARRLDRVQDRAAPDDATPSAGSRTSAVLGRALSLDRHFAAALQASNSETQMPRCRSGHRSCTVYACRAVSPAPGFPETTSCATVAGRSTGSPRPLGLEEVVPFEPFDRTRRASSFARHARSSDSRTPPGRTGARHGPLDVRPPRAPVRRDPRNSVGGNPVDGSSGC
jgi:hypothetical protein